MINYFYLHLPSALQSFALSAFAILNDRRRYGGFYQTIEKETIARHKWSNVKLAEYQKKQLSLHFKYAVKSKYWHKVFKENNVNIDENPFDQLKKLPILTKNILKDNAKSILIPSQAKLYESHTSGTTGSGLKLWENQAAEAARWATWWRYRKLYNLNRDTWHGVFGGRTIMKPTSITAPYHRINYISKQVIFSCYHLSAVTVHKYIEAIEKHQLVWLHGYPSFLSEIARLAIKNGVKLNFNPKIITLGAENISLLQSKIIHEYFGVFPVQHYGLAESVANFSQLPEQPHLTVDEDFSYVEFIDNGNSQKKIIGTNFTNPNFPLFRYDTGDLASDIDETVFPRKVGHVDGRSEDIITLANGKKIGRLDHIFKDAVFIDEAQIFQPNIHDLIVRVIRNKLWNSDSESFLLAEFYARLGREVTIKFEYPESLDRTKSGKLRFVISEVK